MLNRPKLFLTFLSLCLAPLILLALLNYWNGVHIAKAALEREEQLRLAASKDPIARLLYENQAGPNTATRTASSEPLLAAARWDGWLGFIAALLLAALSAWFLSRHWGRQTRGLKRVTEGVEAIAQGKLDYRIELSSDNLRPLAENVGLMSKQLRDQLARSKFGARP